MQIVFRTTNSIHYFTGMNQDGELKPHEGSEPAIIVKISVPDFAFELEIDLGSGGLTLGDNTGWKFTYMKLMINKRLIGLELSCEMEMDSTKDDKQVSTFTGEVAVRLYTFKDWTLTNKICTC